MSSKVRLPKLSFIGYCLILLGMLGCNSETSITNEKNDPVLVEYPVVYIERDIATNEADGNQDLAQFSARDPAKFNAGANILFKKNAFTDSPVTNLTATLFCDNQRIDVRDLTVSDDGQQFLVSIRAPTIENADDNEQPHWNIWRYQLATKTLTRIVVDDVIAEQGDDLMPTFLPDGRIIFASTRQRRARAILLDEGKPQYTALTERQNQSTFNIHIMNADGSNIKQLTFNLSHDFYPLVLQDGHILYSRWDAMGGEHGINLYRMNPDGSDNQLIFGWHSHQLAVNEQNIAIDFIKPQQLPNGDIFMLLGNKQASAYQKKPIVININDYIDNQQPIANSSAPNSAITDLALGDNLTFNFLDELSSSGRLNSLFPLPDNSARFLLSWDLCRVVADGLTKGCGQFTAEQLATLPLAQPLYELWLFNKIDNTQQLVASTEQGKILTEAIVMQPSEQPKTFIEDKTIGNELDAQLANELSAAIDIRSVYDFDGQDITITTNNPQGINTLSDPLLTPAINLPARFLRVVRGVPMPPRKVRRVKGSDFGRSRNQLMREIIGYAPIQPDGSVKIKVPADVPLALSVLDINGQRIGGRHRQWITLKAGETLQCNGCHRANSQLPHGRNDAQAASINAGAITGGSPFPHATNTIIPTQGQTMAQADAMVNGLTSLTADISYQDLWTDPQLSSINASFNYRYTDLSTLAPTGNECFQQWNSFCRLQINYVAHIAPLWELSRKVLDSNTQELISDNTCTACHNTLDSDLLAQVPAGQLNLSSAPSTDNPDHLTNYRELLFNDVEQEVIDGILVDKLIELLDDNGNVVFEVDANGELILDANGDPIPVLTTINVNPILSTNGARASQRFFDLFTTGTHQNRLTVAELKLLAEWLDIGAQYYNTPFYQQD
ncbi:MAG: PD40 domain-containing protein [Alteromonadaceae bacterium]|nr:PD40 domain-containing protein [Alteromonadaceae bacterium]